MGKDLGTYHVKVELEDGRGFIQSWRTGRRFAGGTESWSPIDAQPILPAFDSEEELIKSIVYYYTDGNGGSDGNLSLFLGYAYPQEDIEELECGDTLRVQSMIVVRPSGEEVVAYEAKSSSSAKENHRSAPLR